MDLKPRLSSAANAIPTSLGWRLTIPAGPVNRYRISQLDDHLHIARRNYPHHTPLTMSLRARVSSDSIPGTWGFGLWNDPFGFSIGPGEGFFHLPALPNAVWFFNASPQNYLSFHDDKPAQGFLAQTFHAPAFDSLLIPAGFALPFSRKTTRRLLGRVIEEDGVRLSVDVTQWHGYKLDWSAKRVIFEVDDVKVLETPVSPRSPLGVVIWIDNQYAAFTPEGKIGFGVLEGKEEWLEIEELEIKGSPE